LYQKLDYRHGEDAADGSDDWKRLADEMVERVVLMKIEV